MSIGHKIEFRVVPQNIGGKETAARFSVTLSVPEM
jgi:hypothetical protein